MWCNTGCAYSARAGLAVAGIAIVGQKSCGGPSSWDEAASSTALWVDTEHTSSWIDSDVTREPIGTGGCSG